MSIAVPLRSVACHNPSDTPRFTPDHLQAHFSHNKQTLLLIVRKVLDDDERASEVVAKCFARARKLFRTFADEAELRRWLVRLAIEEALHVVRRENMVGVSLARPSASLTKPVTF